MDHKVEVLITTDGDSHSRTYSFSSAEEAANAALDAATLVRNRCTAKKPRRADQVSETPSLATNETTHIAES